MRKPLYQYNEAALCRRSEPSVHVSPREVSSSIPPCFHHYLLRLDYTMQSGFLRAIPRRKLKKPRKQAEQKLPRVVEQNRPLIRSPADRDDTINAQSGIHMLPPEVLHIILEMYTENERHSINKHHPLLILSAVCSLWRTVVIMDSSLWASFRLNITTFVTPQALSSTKNILELFISRSQNQPLRMEIRPKGQQGDNTENMPSRLSVMRVLSLKYFHLFTELDFITQTEDAYCRLATLGTDSSTLTKLQKLSLRIKTQVIESHPDLKLFNHAPNLKQLCLHSESMLTTFKFALPFHQITQLDFRIKERFGDFAIMAWQYLLAECSNLEDASVRFLSGHHSEGMGSTPPLGGSTRLQIFSTIQRLSIYNDFSGDASAIFGGGAHFPSLQSLEIKARVRYRIFSNKRDPDVQETGPPTSYLNLDILNSSVTLGGLESLRLVKVSIHADVLLTLLHLTPRLMELEILSVRERPGSDILIGRPYTVVSADQDILRILSASDRQIEAGDYLCPDLRSLSLRDPSDSEDGGEVGKPYAELARSRSKILNRTGIEQPFCLTLFFVKTGGRGVRRSTVV
ncbi:hypothetical protein CPB83DRAFT_647206 [Crepidotus variabilis]|uniref:F-box domain-containing protein n=1 Tax=Crepidotus variabilis TaxID=179855 RepID=A0A9P6E7D4_9AGAR|nr:hypothetical protein CPB83DRAFT_647206 [Crepidotus variabilis]